MKLKSFHIPLSHTDRIRVEIRKKDHKLSEFVVQYEALILGEWREIVRYDNRGEPPHKDIFDPRGKKYKSALPNIEPEVLIPSCVEELKENWEQYKEKYLRWMRLTES